MAAEEQPLLFEKGEWWDEHWQGMPEYKSENLKPYRTLLVHFSTPEDVKEFQKVIGQKVMLNQRWIWFPESDARARGVGMFAEKQWIDSASEEDEILAEGGENELPLSDLYPD